MKHRGLWAGFLLLLIYTVCLAAPWLAPYDPAAQNRLLPWAPPTMPHFFDDEGAHLRPRIHPLEPVLDTFDEYEPNREVSVPLRFFVETESFQADGSVTRQKRFLGVDTEKYPDAHLALLGTDELGRDVFSRVLHGARRSLSAGLLAALATVSLGTLLGGVAGYFGGLLDETLMRLAELALMMPTLYLLLAVRAFLPLDVDPDRALLLFLLLVATVAWPGTARLVRAVVLGAKERDYVLAARGFGASEVDIFRRHVLPETRPVVLQQFVLLVPQLILAEAVLSFLGLGLGDSAPSLGTLLTPLQRYDVLASYGWMTAPGILLFVVILCFYRLADGVRESSQS